MRYNDLKPGQGFAFTRRQNSGVLMIRPANARTSYYNTETRCWGMEPQTLEPVTPMDIPSEVANGLAYQGVLLEVAR